MLGGADGTSQGLLVLNSDGSTAPKSHHAKMAVMVPLVFKGVTSLSASDLLVVHQGKVYEKLEMFGAGDDDEGDCVICLSDPASVTLLPCRHRCVCNEWCVYCLFVVKCGLIFSAVLFVLSSARCAERRTGLI